MKWPAVVTLIMILVASSIQPVAELANILKEKVVLNSALINSCRAAGNNATDIWQMKDLNAYVSEDEFINYFSEAFSQTLNLTPGSKTGNAVRFTSNDGRFNDITIEFDLRYTTYSGLNDEYLGVTNFHDRPVTLVTTRMKTPYMFRTYWLKMANDVSNESYTMTETRKLLIQIIN